MIAPQGNHRYRMKPEWKLDGVNLLPYLTGEEAGVPNAALYWRFGWQFANPHGRNGKAN